MSEEPDDFSFPSRTESRILKAHEIERRLTREKSLLNGEKLEETEELVGEEYDFPEGGWRAWLVVLGASHCVFGTFGFLNSWGIFQQYYEDTLFPEQSSSAIAWIGSLQYLLIYFPGLFMGRLVDSSTFYKPFYIAAIIYPVALIVNAEVKQYWQAILCQGILFGISGGILFCPVFPVIGHWFHRKRALALGICTAAGSIGGVVFPVLVKNAIPRVGFRWTMRICGFIILYCTVFASATLRSRLPPKPIQGPLINPQAFRSPPYALFSIAAFLIALGLYTPLSYIDITGTSIGLGEYSSYLVAVANAGSLAGRLLPALIADRVGPINLLIPVSHFVDIQTFAWPYSTTGPSLTAIAVFNGCFQGMYVSLLGPSVSQLGDHSDLGRRVGMILSLTSLGCLIGPPVSGALLKQSGLKGVSYFAGITVLVGAIAMMGSRWYALRRLWGRI
ncbi:hypothetical protein TREMEDRAFT_35282 [Tremella mesenterica DSM 1558]|uniref:uncharacterized protein n=1 Tax=Tremella mesenterica (strain ATCC 24925 / CBS 8224 / DSM 1558 / NBRC 9311 / NRRL Y-6157 / RJB 2259-6 / UBC 559-6) TaxID=578456 RepID=UPI00032D416F|nr:uncharacterized protein TREMEDRAFT_35282 [Tremella mesenterica DSM 1558]EIW66391.1 hypothetical protein TREMEDRAFT_35282 [Tremella mesenterica DSM 1558]